MQASSRPSAPHRRRPRTSRGHPPLSTPGIRARSPPRTHAHRPLAPFRWRRAAPALLRDTKRAPRLAPEPLSTPRYPRTRRRQRRPRGRSTRRPSTRVRRTVSTRRWCIASSPKRSPTGELPSPRNHFGFARGAGSGISPAHSPTARPAASGGLKQMDLHQARRRLKTAFAASSQTFVCMLIAKAEVYLYWS